MSTVRLSAVAVQISAADGRVVRAFAYGSREGARASVVINSALGVSQEYYALFAESLASRGYYVLTYDYRGNGVRGPQLRAIQASLTDWGTLDFAAVVDHAERAAPQLPILCVGHSVGGQLLGLLPNNNRVVAMVAVASQVGYWGYWSGREKWKSWFTFHFAIPLLTLLLGYYPGSRLGACDLPAGVAREWARWCRSAAYIRDAAGKPQRSGFLGYRGRALFISLYDDPLFAPRRAVAALCGYFQNAHREHVHIEPETVKGKSVGHLGFFRKPLGRQLWPMVLDWFDTAVPNHKENYHAIQQ